MAILAFQKPDKVIMLESTDKFGKFEFRPLEPGYGITIGNPLRRILLSSLEGFAITGIKIHGVEHEFATIPGVIEDVTEIILNLKQVRFKRKVEDVEDEKLTVLINGQEAFKAGDINKFLTGSILNSSSVIWTLLLISRWKLRSRKGAVMFLVQKICRQRPKRDLSLLMPFILRSGM